MFQLEKPPRKYASEIIALKTKRERVQALALVPNHFKNLVQTHVEISFAMRKKSR